MPLRLRLLLLAMLFLLSSCLEFDAQEITFRYDAQQDRIDAIVVYRGVFAEDGQGSSDKPMEKALTDLDKAMKNGQFAFWCNWPLKVDPTVDAGPGRALLPHMEVETGGLFTDPKGVLCGYQFVRIREAKAFLQKLNTMLEVGLQAATLAGVTQNGVNHKFHADTREALREFLRSGEKMLVIEPGRVELRLPCAVSDHRWVKQQLEEHFLDNLPREMTRRYGTDLLRARGGDITETSVNPASVDIRGDALKDLIHNSATYRFFWDNDFTIERKDDVTTVGVGHHGAEELVVKKASDGLYHDALLNKLRERGDKIEDGLPDQELARRFAAFRGRDCVLAEHLAETRKAGAPDKDAAKDAEKDKERRVDR